MKAKEIRAVMDVVETEGFDYAFVGYSAFDDIQDAEFHKKREAFLAARRELAELIGHED